MEEFGIVVSATNISKEVQGHWHSQMISLAWCRNTFLARDISLMFIKIVTSAPIVFLSPIH